MNRALFCLHGGLVFGAYSLFGLSFLFFARTAASGMQEVMVRSAVAILAASGFLTGVGVMSMKKSRSESIALAFTTVAAFLLLVPML
jgi:hypothetical protein